MSFFSQFNLKELSKLWWKTKLNRKIDAAQHNLFLIHGGGKILF